MPLSRRDFLKNGIQVAALGLVAPSFLVKAAYAISDATASPANLALSRADGDGGAAPAPDPRANNILVVVQLSGGNDGLGTVIPYADPTYYQVRPNLGVPKEQVLPLTDRMGLHPSLKSLRDLYA